MKVIAAEVAAHLGMLTRKAAIESQTTTGEMASAKAAAHASAAADPPAHVSGAAESAAHMTATTKSASHMTATAASAPVSTSTSTSPTAARKRVGGQSSGESGSRQQHDHGLA
jgi:hypothetical protein